MKEKENVEVIMGCLVMPTSGKRNEEGEGGKGKTKKEEEEKRGNRVRNAKRKKGNRTVDRA